MDNDEKSRDVSNATLDAKLTHTGRQAKQVWVNNKTEALTVHTFTMEGSRFIYQLLVQEDHSFSAIRVDPDRPYTTPRTMNEAFAKLLYMKAWPDVD